MNASAISKIISAGTVLVVLGVCVMFNAMSAKALYISALGVVLWAAGLLVALLG